MTVAEREAKRERDRASKKRTRARARGIEVPTEPKRRTIRAGRAVIRFGATMPDLRGALCVGEDPELWFSDNPEDRELAIAICAACPVRLGCLDYANRSDERFGIWAGEDRGASAPKRSAAA